MKLEDGEYCRKVSKKNSSLVLTIPAPLVKKMGIEVGQLMKISEQDGLLVWGDLEAAGTKGRKRFVVKQTRGTKPAEDEQGPHHIVDMDDPDYNPINRLAL